jgi:hypothetical protein
MHRNTGQPGRNWRAALLLLGLIFLLPLSGLAAPIVNGGFESGNFTGWTTSYNSPDTSIPDMQPYVNIATLGMTAEYTNGALPSVYSGQYSAYLYSGYQANTSGPQGHTSWQRLEQTFTVPAGNSQLEFMFAAVLDGYHYYLAQQTATTYDPAADAYIMVEVMNGGSAIYSRQYGYGITFPFLITPVPNIYVTKVLPLGTSGYGGPMGYLPWTPVDVPLDPWVGQDVDLRITAYNCDYQLHSSYAYLDDVHFIPPFTYTPSPSNTPSDTPTASPTATISPTRTITQTLTASPSPTITCSPTQTPRPLILHPLPASPNPFGDKGVYIAYWLYTDAKINIHVYDVSGELIRDLPTFPGKSGDNETFWDGKNNAGRPVSSGVYIYEIVATTPRDEVAHAFSKCAALR